MSPCTTYGIGVDTERTSVLPPRTTGTDRLSWLAAVALLPQYRESDLFNGLQGIDTPERLDPGSSRTEPRLRLGGVGPTGPRTTGDGRLSSGGAGDGGACPTSPLTKSQPAASGFCDDHPLFRGRSPPTAQQHESGRNPCGSAVCRPRCVTFSCGLSLRSSTMDLVRPPQLGTRRRCRRGSSAPSFGSWGW